MGVDNAQIRIQNKAGVIVTVPLKLWENGLKLDPDWHVYVLPKQPEQPLKLPVIVAMKAAPVVVKKAKRKGK